MTNEPLRDALAMSNALLRLLNELHDDDPGDDDARIAPCLERARQHAQNLVDTLQEIAR